MVLPGKKNDATVEKCFEANRGGDVNLDKGVYTPKN